LGKMNGGTSYTRPGRTLSASARRRISLAQKKRWAKAKGQVVTAKPTRTISAASKKRIAAAQRARWAKLKAAKKKAS
jgi:hypothetical protein